MEQDRQGWAPGTRQWAYPGPQDVSTTGIFEARESAVRSYCRTWPKVFDRAVGSWLYDEDGRAYLDFFTGASALNYGHNNPVLKQALLDYVASDKVTHSLDMHTVAKREFLIALDELILQPRQLNYRVQFPGPGGTNAVEAALKLARKVTGRTEVIAFSDAFHGMTLGALSVTASEFHRNGAGVPLTNTIRVPFCCRLDGDEPGSPGIERQLKDSGASLDQVAAVIVETVQADGGLNAAPPEWLSELAQIVPATRRPAHRRRHPDGLRPDRAVLQLRAGRHHSGHRLPFQVNQRVRPANGAHTDPPGAGHLEAG
jgi:diaminobutyrate-2-oxoglutarate transaminase